MFSSNFPQNCQESTCCKQQPQNHYHQPLTSPSMIIILWSSISSHTRSSLIYHHFLRTLFSISNIIWSILVSDFPHSNLFKIHIHFLNSQMNYTTINKILTLLLYYKFFSRKFTFSWERIFKQPDTEDSQQMVITHDNNSLTLRVLGHTLIETSTLTCSGLLWDVFLTALHCSAPSMRWRNHSVLQLLLTEATEQITEHNYVQVLHSGGKTCKQVCLLLAVNLMFEVKEKNSSMITHCDIVPISTITYCATVGILQHDHILCHSTMQQDHCAIVPSSIQTMCHS